VVKRRTLSIGLCIVAAGCGSNGEAGERDSTSDRAVELARGEAPDGRQIEIRTWSDTAGLCLRIIGLPHGPRECGLPPSETIPPRAALGADAIVRITPRSRLELYGAARPEVKRVDVRFRFPSGCPGLRSAALIRVEDREALRAGHISEPFGYFIAFVPGQAREVVAIGRDASGAVVRRVKFDPIVDSVHPHSFIARQLRSTSR
jgi:hypothetical protein